MGEEIAAVLQGCRTCGRELKGRTDKRFCDDYCRSSFNKRYRPAPTSVERMINRHLNRNRNILAALLNGKRNYLRVSKRRLDNSGFNYKYTTHSFETRSGTFYNCCYDYGYAQSEKGWFRIIRINDQYNLL